MKTEPTFDKDLFIDEAMLKALNEIQASQLPSANRMSTGLNGFQTYNDLPKSQGDIHQVVQYRVPEITHLKTKRVLNMWKDWARRDS